MGKAITIAMITILVKSADKRRTMPKSLDPSILRIPISFSLRSAVKAAKPNNPRQEIRIANPAKYLDKVDTLCSAAYWA